MLNLSALLSPAFSALLQTQDANDVLPKAISADGGGNWYFPAEASTLAAETDNLHWFIFWFSTLFIVLIFAVLGYFLMNYSEKVHPKSVRTTTHNTALEMVWTVLPSIPLIYMFWAGFEGYMDHRTPPHDAYEIKVTAAKWFWTFEYPNGVISPEVHVPLHKDVVFTITSQDVLHSFYIPVFRTKMDAVPGRYTKSWVNATRPGEYALMCAEYCGTKHSQMWAKVFVHDQAGFDAWMAAASDTTHVPPLELGQRLYKQRGCAGCHTLDGVAGTGPTWKGIWGRTETLSDGSSVVVDENYVRESILNPTAKIVKGFQGVMPTFQGKFKEHELNAIFEFMKTVK